MVDSRVDNAEAYLRGHLEPMTTEIKGTGIPPNYHFIQEPFQKLSYKDEGVIIVGRENVRFSFHYKPVNEETVPKPVLSRLDHELEELKSAMDPVTFKPVSICLTRSDFRVLEEMRVKGTAINYEFNIQDFLPRNSTVLFNPVDKIGKNQGMYIPVENDSSSNLFLIFGLDFTIPEALLCLLHEVGHGRISRGNDLQEQDQKDKYTATVISSANLIRNERDAHSFVWRLLHPFVRARSKIFSKENIDYFIRDKLQGYSNVTRHKLFRVSNKY